MSELAYCLEWEHPALRRADEFDGDDTNTETVSDPYPPRRKFFHVTQFKAGMTVFVSTISAVTISLALFTTIVNSTLDHRMLSERDWLASHYVSRESEDERTHELDRRLVEIRETQVQIATMIDEMKKQIFDRGRK